MTNSKTNIAMAVHGGASELTPFVKKHRNKIKQGLDHALTCGYDILKAGGSALDAVEQAVILLENDPHFNAGRGSALNSNGEVEMDAAIMHGKDLDAGCVSIVRNVKNPIRLARVVMHKTKHVFLAGYGALELARINEMDLAPDDYFITNYQYQLFLDYQKHMQKPPKTHGTVGAVALDQHGNLASATSTGGTSYCLPGRIGDSCVIGAGCYADNNTCAVSGTGDGEILIRRVIAHTISFLVAAKGLSLQEACDYAIFQHYPDIHGEIGVIAVNPAGEIGITFNCDIMKRAWIDKSGVKKIEIT